MGKLCVTVLKNCFEGFCSFQVKEELLVKALTKKRVVTAKDTVVSQYTLQEVQSFLLI